MNTTWLINKRTTASIKQVLINLKASYLGILLTILAITSISVSNFLNFLATKIDMGIDKQKTENLAFEVLNTFFIYKVSFYVLVQIRYMLSSPILETFKVTISQKLYVNFISTNDSINFGKIQVLVENTTSGMTRIAQILFFDILSYSVTSILSIKTINSLFGAKYNVIILTMLAILLLLEYLIVWISTTLKDRMIKAQYKLNQQLRETDHNMDVIKAHSLVNRESMKYTRFLCEFRKAKIWYDVASAVEGSVFPIVFTCFRYLIVYMFLQSDLSLESKNKDIRYLGVLMDFIYVNLRSFTLLYTNFKVSVVQCQDGIDLLDNKEINNKARLERFCNSGDYGNNFDEISIKSFVIDKEGFERKYKQLEINKGDKVAITGCNGVGKTTFLKELFKLRNIQGVLKIARSDSAIKKSVRISYVPQKIQLFNDTVDYNIETACDRNLWTLANSLPHIKGPIGDFGEKLSKGQQQLLQIIRALSRDSDVVIMDEPLAFLDCEIKNKLVDYIFESDKTMFICTHNTQIVEKCDTIYEIE